MITIGPNVFFNNLENLSQYNAEVKQDRENESKFYVCGTYLGTNKT